MGEAFDYVPTQLTKAFREAQADEKFQGWLKMQEAVMGIEFPIYDLPEVRDSMFTKDSLAIAEAKLIELYDSNRAAYAGEENVHRTMRYVYYVGETFRRAFEGTWVAIPPLGDKPRREGLLPGVDLPFRENFVNPTQLIHLALTRRSGVEITRVYGYAERDYNEWLDAGKPPRTYLGTLREGD
ncbi:MULTISPECIES: hypothetical protein [Mycobacteroides]|uniref:hypothetical protein n=1 Tax=Mycobacteroides TaxID=670516 RepID=UPI00099283FA|nr:MULTISPECIES: hypothetical protein [Mycobacteroides]SKK72035.1 Uncharacterised protein [Mycobacteroides abscessus subsp. massiliense]SKL19188.1 Uncharacterised protein [Mycobacteroides abscessus subsp. massiliense]SKL78009.1 Uncharacterised protein [Mycobacteroides abscessus subsp. massiliense]SKM91315.1 Uncharacterised protein [Mycobacteroides abscessus subsp. massiliense]SKO47500.1 Uncharacterised protein [Mycobacteroides abscessus subsp. massiliense]